MARRVAGAPRYSLYDDLRARQRDLEPTELAALTVIAAVFQDVEVAIPINSLWWRIVYIKGGRITYTRKSKTRNHQ